MGDNMKKILLVLFVLLIPLASALDECGDSVPTDKACTLITPIISCSTLDIYHSDGTQFISSSVNGSMSQIGTTGIYNYTINFTSADTYIVDLCDNEASRSVIVFDVDSSGEFVSWWRYLLQIYYNTLPGAW